MGVIQVHDLTKDYGRFRALHGATFSVGKGEVMGFIGPNGAGKTTTIRILLGLLRKNSGEAKIHGKDSWHDALEIHKTLAYVPGDVNLWPSLSGGEIIDLISKLRGGINPQRRNAMLRRFELDPTKKFRTYSKGNRQKVAIVSALASDAEVFIFDEPTSGLDPLMEAIFLDCVLELKQQGKTILLSSHTLALVEKLCDRVSIIRKGTIVESGTLDELRHLTRTTVTVETNRPILGLDRVDGIHDLDVQGHGARFQIESNKLHQVLTYLGQFEFKSLISRPPSLEELFIHHYDESTECMNAHTKGRYTQ